MTKNARAVSSEHCRPSPLAQLLRDKLVQVEQRRLDGQIWPLVKRARLWGPWKVLSHGLVFVDLPGFGDVNSVRSRVANREYARAGFICICSRIDGAATERESVAWLQKASRDLARGNVVHVCTKSDDVNRQEVVQASFFDAKGTPDRRVTGWLVG